MFVFIPEMMPVYIIAGVFMVISLAVSGVMKARFRKYSNSPLRKGLSGREVAERMLRENGITDVEIMSTPGQLTDHYNPLKKTINLSEEVYHGRHIAAAAVAAHETGHAVQHARSYAWLTMRSKLVPAVSIASRFQQWIILAGLLMLGMGIGKVLLGVGIVLFGATTLFSFVTLPVEFDASNRALQWLGGTNVATKEEYGMAKNALFWAAMTYVVAALGSLATLMYYIMLFLQRR